MKFLYTIVVLGCIFAITNAQLETCGDEQLQEIFSAAQNHRCIVARITSTNSIYHTTSYTEGSLYYSRYTDSLHNILRPENVFPQVDSNELNCINGKEQPFSVKSATNLATNGFDIGINRTGVVTFQSNNVIKQQFTTGCYNNYRIGVDSVSTVHIVELRALPIELPCPTYFGKSCEGVGATNSCLPQQIYTGGQCYYRTCSEIDCGGRVCINNGGIARCINAYPNPTTAPALATETKRRFTMRN